MPFASLARPPARHPHGDGLSLCRSSGRLYISTYPSATAPLRSPFLFARRPRSRPGNPARLRRSGGRRRFALSAAREPRCASLETRSAQPPRLRLRPASPTPGERGRSSCQPTGSQPLLAFARDSLCLPRIVPYRLRQELSAPNIPAASFGVNRLPSSFASLGRGLYYGRYPH